MYNKEKQAKRIQTLTEMMLEEIGSHLEQAKKYEVWLKTNPGNYMFMPDVPKENLKRIMLMLRKETIKFERMM